MDWKTDKVRETVSKCLRSVMRIPKQRYRKQDFCIPSKKTFLSGVTKRFIRIVSYIKRIIIMSVFEFPFMFLHHTALCHFHIASSLHAVSSLGDLVPLPGARCLEGGREKACSSRRCKAKPSRRHGLQHADVC